MSNDEMLPEGYALLINQIQSITKALNDDDQISTFNETDILIKSLDPEQFKIYKAEKLQKKLKEYLLNTDNNRYLRVFQKVKLDPETAVHYYDRDLGQDPLLFYQEEQEKKVLAINDEIRTLIANIIKDRLSDNINFE